MSLRWGVLSTADITDMLLGSGSDQEFVAVASRDLGRAQAWAGERPGPDRGEVYAAARERFRGLCPALRPLQV
jgi:hypothetical protein